MQYVLIPLITLSIFIAGFLNITWEQTEGISNFLHFNKPQIGTTLTTINATDRISDSRAVINTNFTALNSGKIEISTTTLPLITTLANLSTVGTITTGTWSADAIAVAKGGTGTTTPTQYLVILGNGSAGLTHATSTGTAGQFLTSSGAGAFPYWSSATFDTTDNYSVSGTWTFSGINTFSATSTMATTSISVLTVGTSTLSTLYAPQINTLVGGAASNAQSLHYHANNCAVGFANKATNNTDDQVITHNLGVAPSLIEIEARVSLNAFSVLSTGYASAATSSQAYIYTNDGADTGNDASNGGTGHIVYLPNIDGSSGNASAILWSTAATTFTLQWDENDNAGGTRYLLWKACK